MHCANRKSKIVNGIWLPDMDLNHDKQIQSLLCYRYTIGQAGAFVRLNSFAAQSSRRCCLNWIQMVFAVIGLGLFIGCSTPSVMEGDLCYIKNENGSYSVLKILKVDKDGVHVRLYSNQFSTPPTHVEENTLYMSGMERKPDESLGMGHAPLSKKSFKGWKAVKFQKSTVKDEELEGYKMWSEASGGYF